MILKNMTLAALMLATAMPLRVVAQEAVTDAAPVAAGEAEVKMIDSSGIAPPMTASEQTVPPSDPSDQAVSQNGNIAGAPQAASSPSAIPAVAVPTPELTPETSTTPVEREMAEHLAFVRPNVAISSIPSLFLTLWESDLVADARLGLNIRPQADDVTTAGEPGEVIASPREVALGGIVYRSKKNWVIWLNNRRVSPNAIPNEVYDLKVFKEHIDLEWFDATTNQVYPIRLRTYQRFNLDSRIFLPG